MYKIQTKIFNEISWILVILENREQNKEIKSLKPEQNYVFLSQKKIGPKQQKRLFVSSHVTELY